MSGRSVWAVTMASRRRAIVNAHTFVITDLLDVYVDSQGCGLFLSLTPTPKERKALNTMLRIQYWMSPSVTVTLISLKVRGSYYGNIDPSLDVINKRWGWLTILLVLDNCGLHKGSLCLWKCTCDFIPHSTGLLLPFRLPISWLDLL